MMKTFKTGSLFWDCYARCYDGLLSTVPYQRLLEQTLSRVPSDACTLLDAGCGTGNLLHAVQRKYPAISLYGIDFSETMLKRARSKLYEAVLTTGDLNAALPYPDSSFDVVTCINVLYAVAQPDRTLAELRRVLKPGGTLIVSSPFARPRMSSLIREHAAAAGWCRTIPLLARSIALVLFNALIIRRGRGQYHFMDRRTVRDLLSCETINEAYAGLNWFACAIKE